MAPDYEGGGDNQYEVEVRAASSGFSDVQAISVFVTNGDGTADFVIRLTGLINLGASDFSV